MSGQCNQCSEHVLDCVCIPMVGGHDPISISINKEHFREEFSKIFDKWDQKLWHGIDEEGKKELLNDLINEM